MKASGSGGPEFEAPREHYFGPAAMLALAVHVLLAAALMLGVHWQSRAPEVVTVELWQPPAPVARPEPPKVEAPKPAPPPPPPPPPAKPEPRIEKPDIALKEPPKPKPKPKPEPKPVPKPEPKPKPKPAPVAKPAPPPPDETHAKQLFAQALEREEQRRAAERERQALKDQLAREQLAARNRAMATWIDKIRDQIRRNIVLPPNMQGNPQAEVLVTLLPNYEVLDAKLLISSGHPAYDDAVLRAIIKASPLPKPDTQIRFERDMRLTFRPKD